MNQMGNHISCDGEVSVRAWGESAGEEWSYRAKHGDIKQIIVIHGDCINSIKFKDDTTAEYSTIKFKDDTTAEYSRRFGGDRGTRTDKVDIDFPEEFLTGISGTYDSGVRSLKFHTNQTEYGPFGHESIIPFSFCAEGIITGFHGRASPDNIYAIGVYLKPNCSYLLMRLMGQSSEIDRRRKLGLLPRSPGPWGSINGGREWDDGVFAAVTWIRVHVRFTGDVDVITAVEFKYEKRDGNPFWSKVHGTDQSGEIKRLEIDGDTEFLIGVEGFYGPVEGSGNVDVIRSVTFHTNKGSWGPFGSEIGTYFSSMSSIDGNKGKVVGFHGRSGAYLNAIGVHREYYTKG